MSFNPNRRQVLLGTAASLTGLALSGSRALADDVRLRYFFWGGPGRSDRKVDTVQKFAKTKGWSIDAEWSPWGDYWPRLSTQIAGGNAPDLIQMDYRYIYEYARRDVLLPLDGFVPKPMDILGFGDQRLQSGKVDNKLYGVTIGDNALGLGYNADAWKAAGVEIPTDMTWDSYRQLCAAFTKGRKEDRLYASDNLGGSDTVFEIWLRQRAKALYVEDHLGFSADDLTEWFTYWQSLSKDGLVPPADIEALYQRNVETSMMVTGHAAAGAHWSNELKPISDIVKFTVAFAPFPKASADSKSGMYLKPSQFMSIYTKSANPEAAAETINYLTNTLQAAKDQGVDTAIPPSAAVRKALDPTLDPVSRRSLAFVELISQRADPLPIPPLPGAGEVADRLFEANMQVSFGNQSPKDSAATFIGQANDILTRAKSS